eukprot:g7855.t1
MWVKTTCGGGGVAAQAGAVEKDAGAVDARPQSSLSPPLEVLFRNREFAAVCKPPLMHVHRPEFGSKDKEFVMQKARNQLGHRIYLPHRLDRGTSGCLLLGFSPEAGKVLHRALADSSSTKTYVAIVRGSGKAFVGKGWFTVDRPIKDDKKVLRGASTRFLFVRGGNAPDPRCCLVLAQPSSGRFHQIRRHLNGISHPVVGDSVHGSNRFNRELVAHPTNPAPAGRLLLHCLRLELPTLPGAESTAWRTRAPAADNQRLEGNRRRGGSEKARPVRGDSQEALRRGGSGGDCFSDSDGGWAPPSASEEEPLGDEGVWSGVTAVSSLPAPYPPSPVAAFSVPQMGSIVGTGKATAQADAGDAPDDTGVDGFEVYAEPPDDMLAFLRGMSWWEEGMIQAAERRGRRASSPS